MMVGILSFEWLKFSKRWMPRIILLLVLALVVLGFWGQGTRVQDQPDLLLPRGWLAALILCSFFAPFFWPVLGGSWAGNEYGWGTIRMILTRRPHRIQHALGALAVLTAGLAVALIAVLIVATVASLVIALLTHNSAFVSGALSASFLGTLVKTFLSAWYIATFYLVVAYAAGVIFRSAAVGIGIGIGSTLAEVVVRQIFYGLGGTWKIIAEHFPVLYTTDMATRVASSGFPAGSTIGSPDPSSPSVGHSIVALAIYMAICLVAVAFALRSRDVTA